MAATDLKLPYPRPRSFSDPFNDFTPTPLARLIATPDRDLDWSDFRQILGPYLPAGTYDESAYFLPLAFDYLLSRGESDAGEMVTSLIWFASEYASELKADGALDAVRAKLQDCLAYWTSDFVIEHFDCDACREKGWQRSYFDYVHPRDLLYESVEDLVRFEAYADLAIGFFNQLANADSDPVKSAWFLESVRSHTTGDAYAPPMHPQIKDLLESRRLAVKHSAVVCDLLPGFHPTRTYWRDTFRLLAIPLDAD